MASISSTRHPRRLADYSADYRMLILAAMAVVAGTGGAFSAWALLKLIALATNILWHGRFSFDPAAIMARGALLVLLIPVVGGLIVGLMARFGSDKIRGHGIPEAIETILFGDSRLSPKVALLKPLSSAVSIGSGGPFGAEGPIIMTGGAIGSLFAQLFDLSAAERKTLLVAGATAGMTGIFGTPFASIMLAVELLLFEWKPRSFVPVVTAVLVALAWRPLLISSGPLFPFAAPTPTGIEPLASRRRSASQRDCWPRSCLSCCIGSRTVFTACRSTGCGGRQSVRWWSASAACSTSVCSALVTESSSSSSMAIFW
jgi:CIC family chloride channel protein